MPSPVDWATYPPQRCTASIISLSAGSTMARASSGSRSSISSVEPLMSANRAVTVLRSPSRFSATALSITRIDESFGFLGEAADGPSDAPHSPQKRLPAGLSEPHFGQRLASGAPQSPQNFLPTGFSPPHFEQRTTPPSAGGILRQYRYKALARTRATVDGPAWLHGGRLGHNRPHGVTFTLTSAMLKRD